MKVTLKVALTCTTAMFATAAAAETMTIGITQNNVGVDSYQTTYERAFIAAAEATRMSRLSCWMRAATSPGRSPRWKT